MALTTNLQKPTHDAVMYLFKLLSVLTQALIFLQVRRSDRTKKRRIKRDLVTLPGRKGIAGLKVVTEDGGGDRAGGDGTEASTGSTVIVRHAIPVPATRTHRTSDTNSLSPPTPYNTPQVC